MKTIGLVAAGLGTAIALAAAAPAAQGPTTYFVDTTEDGLEDPNSCADGARCPLRSAVYLANNGGGGLVTAVQCAQPDDTGCLSTADQNYDPVTGQWTFHLDGELGALIMDLADVRLDFRGAVPDWQGPADNVVVIDGGQGAMARAVDIQGPNHLVAGIEFVGAYENAAIEVSRQGEGIVLGPGLLFADVSGKAAIRVRDPNVIAPRIVGNWCGVSRDGAVKPVVGSCLLIDWAANTVVVGGGPESDRNYFAAATGAAVTLVGPGADRNRIEGNMMGRTPAGSNGSIGGAGVDIRDGGQNVVTDNVIVAAWASGLRVAGTSFGNVFRANHIGYVPSGQDGAGERSPNGGWGVALSELAGGTMVEDNVIQYNRAGGILVSGGQADNNRLTHNRIRGNVGPGIQVSGGGNGGVSPPVFSIVQPTRATGTACGECVVELYSSDDGQAWLFEGSTVATAGRFIFQPSSPLRGPYLTATATESGGNTSGLSAPATVPGVPTPTPAATEPVPGWTVFMPLVSRSWTR